MNRNAKLLVLSFIVVAGFALAVGFHYFSGAYQNRPYPYNTFLFMPQVRFSDYYDVIWDSHTLSPYLEYKSAQYPFLIIVGYVLSLIPGCSYYLYLGFVSALFLLFSYLNLRGEHWYDNATPIFILTFLTYPFLFSADRGNFESLLFIFLLAFLFFYQRRKYLVSAIFLSLAISLKLYPAVLLVLFIPEKRFREIAVCLASTAVITFASLMCFKGGFLPNITFLLQGSNISSNSLFTQFTSISSDVVQRGVSLLTLLKIFFSGTGVVTPFIEGNFSTIYMILATFLGILVALYVIFVEKENWKRVALLVFSMLLLPPLSADYKLLYVFIPLFLFLDAKNSPKLDAIYLLMFALLLIPKDYFYLPNVVAETGIHEISISVVINILLLIAISAMIMISGTRNWVSKLRRTNHSVSGATGEITPEP